ncbi:MAG TPA: sigma 54-interacting transcriptional regulator [Sandaracinaceae bacterium LLY-WYZ-13_1]|nr:sigma 54-interacting transcriptional regulator [Sandaracinaceae bacterium LLY-WYZ-13_1]
MDDTSEMETLPTMDTGEGAVGAGPARVTCATIAYHPDPARVGERAAWLRPASGAPLELSRVSPRFKHPGRTDEPRPLADPHLSREPVRVSVAADGSLTLALGDEQGARLDDAPVAGRVSLGLDALERGVTLELRKRVVLLLHRAEPGSAPASHGLVGESPGLLGVRRAIDRVADLDVGVLVRGETGVGKDRVARAIHAASGRRGPYLAVNMATVGRHTAASELFGHVEGAFTGAAGAHAGFFERADGGTLFLDEVGELAEDVQGMLLRTLETGRVLPLGGRAERTVDVRVIAATDADLDAMVERGRFRPALLHRLGGYQIAVPPLRARREDVPRLAFAFLREELAALGEADRLAPRGPSERPWLHRSVIVRLVHHDWPGNVRQLRNVMRQLAISSRGADRAVVDDRVEAILGRARPAAAPAPPTPSSRPSEGIDDAELLRALEAHGWAFGPTARALGLNRTTFYRLVEGHPGVRKGTDLSRAELEAARAEADGDLDAMSRRLRVSKRAIRRRLTELGVDD